LIASRTEESVRSRNLRFPANLRDHLDAPIVCSVMLGVEGHALESWERVSELVTVWIDDVHSHSFAMNFRKEKKIRTDNLYFTTIFIGDP